MKVVVGGVIVKNEKVLLVQEAQEICYGKWSIPVGELEYGESLIEGAEREIKEETGFDVEILGVLNIANRKLDNDLFVNVVFLMKAVSENINHDDEILDVKWFDIEEVLNDMEEKLRNPNFVKIPIENYKNNIIGDLKLINLV